MLSTPRGFVRYIKTYVTNAVTSVDSALISSAIAFCSWFCKLSRVVTSSWRMSKNSASNLRGTSTRWKPGHRFVLLYLLRNWFSRMATRFWTYSSMDSLSNVPSIESMSLPGCLEASFSKYLLVSGDRAASTAIPSSSWTKRVSFGTYVDPAGAFVSFDSEKRWGSNHQNHIERWLHS